MIRCAAVADFDPFLVCNLLESQHPSIANHPFVPASVEHPGEQHKFSIVCDTCGERGWINLSIIGPNERISIEPVRPGPLEVARNLADAVLDRPFADPDDDSAKLARAMLKALGKPGR